MLEISHVAKSFGGVQSLKDVNLQVVAGEIHAILGENGAGKSTLMKIIAGAIPKNSGVIRIDGEEVNFKSPQAAKDKGVGIIYQEFSLVPALSVAENVFLHTLNEQPIINWKKLYASAQQLIQSLNFNLDVKAPVAQLSVAQQQVVEIAKALTGKVKVLILDEPSAVLGPADIHKLFSTLRLLREQGTAIIYISHHLDELVELSDRITILKDGITVNTFVTAQTNKNELVHAMLGRSLNAMFPEKESFSIEPENIRNYTFKGIRINGKLSPVSIHIRSGEILGIGGLVGSGRTELLRAVFGADVQPTKSITRNNRDLPVKNPRMAVLHGIGMVPEDRKQHGGILDISIKENISLSGYRKISGRFGFINQLKEKQVIQGLVNQLKVKLHSINNPLNALSGGNQQKVILAKWLNIDADLLLIDEPTRGVDIGARAEIYRIIHNLAKNGLAIMMVSSDWEELMGLSDRIIIMKSGLVQGEQQRSGFSEEHLLRMAIGAGNE